MSPKLFALQEREELRVKMLDAGFELIKRHGMTHASVEKITAAVGLGKSTFYNFFQSKELFVYEIIQYQRDVAKQDFMNLLADREKMTAAEGRTFLKKIIFSPNSIYQYLTVEDQAKLRASLPPEYGLNPDADRVVMSGLFAHIEGIRSDLDYHLVANLIKTMAIALFHRDSLYQDALRRTLEALYALVFSFVFEEGA